MKHFSIWAIQEEMLPLVARFFQGQLPGQASEENAAIQAAAAASRARSTGLVAVLPIFGGIQARGNLFTKFFGGTGLDDFMAMFRAAMAEPQISHIILDVDSPGGSVYGVEEAAAEIRAAREKKKITAQINAVAGSAAYWLASAASDIVITPSGEAGSIGVYALHLDFSEAASKQGVKPTFIKAGKFKTEGNPLEPLDDEATAYIQKRVDEYHDAFIRAVAEGRGVALKAVREGMGQGRMVGAQDALKMNMADRIGTLEQTIARVAGKRSSGLTAQELAADIVAATWPENTQDTITHEGEQIPVSATDAAAIMDFYKRRTAHAFADA